MTITKTPRHDYRVSGKFTKRPQGSPDAGQDYLARATSKRWDYTDAETTIPTPPAAWSEAAWRSDYAEPIERTDWVHWTALIIGLPAMALFGAGVASLAMTQTLFGLDLSPAFAAVLEWVR